MRVMPLALLATLLACSGPAGPTDPPPAPQPGPVEADYQLNIRDGDQRIGYVQHPLTLSIDITRREGGYEGPITFTADAPEGIVVAFRPATVLRDFTNVILVVEAGVEPRDHTIIFHGTAPGQADRTIPFTLSLRPST